MRHCDFPHTAPLRARKAQDRRNAAKMDWVVARADAINIGGIGLTDAECYRRGNAKETKKWHGVRAKPVPIFLQQCGDARRCQQG